MLKKDGEALVRASHYLFQKNWAEEILPKAFKTELKIMLPKPGKTNYKTVRSYRPNTLESDIGQVMERAVCNR